jgi:hypothetical protein
MTLLEYLDRRHERAVTHKRGPDFLGWVAIGLFGQSSALFAMMCFYRGLTENQGFMTLASAVIVTGWIGGAVGFAYTAGKRDGEQAATISRAVDAMAATAASGNDGPAEVEVVNTPDKPVPTEDA